MTCFQLRCTFDYFYNTIYIYPVFCFKLFFHDEVAFTHPPLHATSQTSSPLLSITLIAFLSLDLPLWCLTSDVSTYQTSVLPPLLSSLSHALYIAYSVALVLLFLQSFPPLSSPSPSPSLSLITSLPPLILYYHPASMSLFLPPSFLIFFIWQSSSFQRLYSRPL